MINIQLFSAGNSNFDHEHQKKHIRFYIITMEKGNKKKDTAKNIDYKDTINKMYRKTEKNIRAATTPHP